MTEIVRSYRRIARRLGVAVLAGLAFCAAPAARAADLTPNERVAAAVPVEPAEEGWLDPLSFSSPFSPCNRNCAVHVFAGPQVISSMSSIFLRGRMPWNWDLGKSVIVGGAFSREVVRYGDYWAFETEIGAAKRFGRQDEWETWAALYFRWKDFPWNDYVRTSLALSTGFNLASGISRHERLKSPGATSHVLHYLSPELTLGLPKYPRWDFVTRFHHRSGGKIALFNDTGGGSQYVTFGLRHHW